MSRRQRRFPNGRPTWPWSTGRIAFVGDGAIRCGPPHDPPPASQVVAPGFIDIHTHSDQPDAGRAGAEQGQPGRDDRVTGNCGFPPFPDQPAAPATAPGSRWPASATTRSRRPNDLQGYREHIGPGVAVNIAPLVGTGTAHRSDGRGYGRRQPGAEMATHAVTAGDAPRPGRHFGLTTGLTDFSMPTRAHRRLVSWCDARLAAAPVRIARARQGPARQRSPLRPAERGAAPGPGRRGSSSGTQPSTRRRNGARPGNGRARLRPPWPRAGMAAFDVILRRVELGADAVQHPPPWQCRRLAA